MMTVLLHLQVATNMYLKTLTARIRRSTWCAPDGSNPGQAFLEYALIIAVVAVIVLVAVQAFGADLSSVFDRIRSRLSRLG